MIRDLIEPIFGGIYRTFKRAFLLTFRPYAAKVTLLEDGGAEMNWRASFAIAAMTLTLGIQLLIAEILGLSYFGDKEDYWIGTLFPILAPFFGIAIAFASILPLKVLKLTNVTTREYFSAWLLTPAVNLITLPFEFIRNLVFHLKYGFPGTANPNYTGIIAQNSEELQSCTTDFASFLCLENVYELKDPLLYSAIDLPLFAIYTFLFFRIIKAFTQIAYWKQIISALIVVITVLGALTALGVAVFMTDA